MRRAIFASAALMALAGSAAMSPSMEVAPEPGPGEATVRTRHKPSGSQPVSGGGTRERARRLAKTKANPEPCCMWCGGEKPEGGWHFLQYPQALCSEQCSSAFKAAI